MEAEDPLVFCVAELLMSVSELCCRSGRAESRTSVFAMLCRVKRRVRWTS